MVYARPAWYKSNPSPNHRLHASHEEPKNLLNRGRPGGGLAFLYYVIAVREMWGHGLRLLLHERVEIERDLPNIGLDLSQHLNEFLLAKCAHEFSP